MDAKNILHKHLIPFELAISTMGITGRVEFETSVINAMEEYADLVKEKVADIILDLPNDCIDNCSDTKFCPNRLDHCNRCKECFSLDNI